MLVDHLQASNRSRLYGMAFLCPVILALLQLQIQYDKMFENYFLWSHALPTDVNRKTGRHIWLQSLPSHNFVGGR